VLEYRPSGVTEGELDARLERDLERGITGAGPHLQDLTIEGAGLDLRAYGSQGQQRLAVLSLLLAEARAIAAARDEPALLLLDDVLSELDDRRRTRLLEAVPQEWQVVITATTARALPPSSRSPDQIVDVVPGKATSR
jgi:DNA replication and repair protein RecF